MTPAVLNRSYLPSRLLSLLARAWLALAFTQAAIGKSFFGMGYICRLLTRCHPRLIAALLSRYSGNIGVDVRFKSPLFIDNISGDQDATNDFSRLQIGDRCYIGAGVFFDLPDQVVLKEECVISAGVRFITHEDTGGRMLAHWYPRKKAPIRVGKGCWIGAGAILLQGVELGKCCVVGAGSVVRDSFPDYSVIAGVPARLVKTLPADH
ncbi:MAG: acyltransferase [Saprospirales bacterium]|nr:acyltransferase [Saprospirales bacterium]MBK8491823.1 acyltransferase [Saprospirales bacterium]